MLTLPFYEQLPLAMMRLGAGVPRVEAMFYLFEAVKFGVCFLLMLAPATCTLENWLRWLLTRPVALLALAVGWPVRHMAECVHRAHHEKKQKKAQARRTKQLQKNAKVLYNSK